MARTLSDTVNEVCALRHGIENATWEEARGKLMAYLRLRGSCVGGDQEEYDALESVIKEFIERIDEDDIYSPNSDEITRLSEENSCLRKLLKSFGSKEPIQLTCDGGGSIQAIVVSESELAAARAAIREGEGDD